MARVGEREPILQQLAGPTDVLTDPETQEAPALSRPKLSGRLFFAALATLAATVGVAGFLAQRKPQHFVPVGPLGSRHQFLSEALTTPKEAAAPARAAEHFKDAEAKEDEAKTLLAASEELNDGVEDLQSQSEGLLGKVDDINKQVGEDTSGAQKDREQAAEIKQKAEDLVKESEGLLAKAGGLDSDKEAKQAKAENKANAAAELTKQAKTMNGQAEAKERLAIDADKSAMHEVKEQRMCLNLPGVKLKVGKALTIEPVVGDVDLTDEQKCTDWCSRHKECKQAVFSHVKKTCELSADASDEPAAFRDTWPWHNSSYCGGLGEKDEMLSKINKVFDAKPWVPPPNNCSWSGDNCIDTKCCADVDKANWDFTKFGVYTCYQITDKSASCKLGGPEKWWDGKNLGSHTATEVAPAPAGKLVQGTRLYCFSVVMWNLPPPQAWQDSEGEIANHWKTQKKGIMQCDDYNIFEGIPGGSVHNIESFIHAWKLVQDDGRWKNNDWTIKVDPDAVFFPEHFRKKVMWNYKTPQGTAVYLRNTFYKFKFLGALEVLSHEATQLYFDRSWDCQKHLTQEGGEDYWLLQCLEGLGINYQTDTELLHDKYAADLTLCTDPNGVGYHFFKKIEGSDGWDTCWNMANDAWNNAHPE